MKIHVVGEHGSFNCPACKEPHSVTFGFNRWLWNRNAEAPTVTPSILVTNGHFVPGFKVGEDNCWCTFNAEHPDDLAPFKCIRCHSYIKDGMIQFLVDSTHELAGKTVPLPEWGSFAA